MIVPPSGRRSALRSERGKRCRSGHYRSSAADAASKRLATCRWRSAISKKAHCSLLSHAQARPERWSGGFVLSDGPLIEQRHPDLTRRAFAGLRELRDTLAGTSGLTLTDLSMGMSGDFEVAIEEGATIIRVGTTITGARAR